MVNQWNKSQLIILPERIRIKYIFIELELHSPGMGLGYPVRPQIGICDSVIAFGT